MAKRKKTYTPAPSLTAQTAERVEAIAAVLRGERTVSDAARSLGLARNHFQTLMNRGVAGLADAVTPKPGGRPRKPAREAELEAEVERLRRENSRLAERVNTTDRLLTVASGLLHGRIRPTRRSAKAAATPEGSGGDDKGDPDAARRTKLEGAREMSALGLKASLAAAIAGVHASTVRRWNALDRRGAPLIHRLGVSRGAPSISPEAQEKAAALVRELRGLVGAESIRQSVPGISRRQAAQVKAQTRTEMERERKADLTRIQVTVPGVMRGIDGMHLQTLAGVRHALIAADAAIPYRTSVSVGERYDSRLVARALERDIQFAGAPLVYRVDRATAHQTPEVLSLLEAHGVLVLHGPPRCPRFYGQLERQNREHRGWLDAAGPLDADPQASLEQMCWAVSAVWKRRTLGWKSAAELWAVRRPLEIDRAALREEVREKAARIGRKLEGRGKPADLAERLAIERVLETRGFLRREIGGWC